MRIFVFTILATLGACSGPTGANAVAANVTGQEVASKAPTAFPILQTESGRYRVELGSKLNTNVLPSNADLKMVDGDLSRYAIKLCDLDFANNLRPDRCEVFVQPDRSGLLVGYAVLTQGRIVSIDTAVETDRQKGGLGCFVGGDLENSNFDNPKAKLNIGRNFEARLAYNAWEKGPGDWMVAPLSDDPNQEGATGVWYVKRLGNKLRISQERWNYCYSGSKVYIDEVFNHALTLTRAGD